MFPTRFISLPIVFAMLFAGFLGSASAEKKESNPWLQINSAHFAVITDAGDKKGREIALRFEQMRAVFSSILNKDQLTEPVPLTILALKNDDEYYKLAPLRNGQPIDVPGFFLPGEDQDFIALNLMEPEPWRAVAGDLARMLLSDNYPPAQSWFDDGLTNYFSSIHVDDQQVQIGGDPVLARSTNQNNGTSSTSVSARPFTGILNNQRWISLPELFEAKAPSTTADSSLFEAESWIVMHYLVHNKMLPNTGTYLGLVFRQHVPISDAIEKAYGMPAAQLEQAVKDYFHSLTALQTALHSGGSAEQPYRYPSLVQPDASAIISKSIPELDARATYAEVQIRIPERRDVGLQTLKTLATTPTPAEIKAEARKQEKRQFTGVDSDANTLPTTAMGDELAHRVLAWDEIQHNDFQAALGELSNAAAIDQQDMWIRYYLCQLKYRMAQATKHEIQGLANMLIDLRSVLEWYPQMSSAYDLLAVTRNEGGTTTEAMQAERAAMSLSPRNQVYVYHMAQIYIAAKKWDAAQALLDRLKTSNNPELVQLAQERLDEIGNQRKYGMSVPNGPQAQLAPQKSPFDVLDEDAAKRAAQEKQQTTEQADTRPMKFVKGRLIAVDCSASPVAILTISTHGSILKLRTADYKSLALIGADQFSCDWHDRQVDANYKPGAQSDGDLVSLEMH